MAQKKPYTKLDRSTSTEGSTVLSKSLGEKRSGEKQTCKKQPEALEELLTPLAIPAAVPHGYEHFHRIHTGNNAAASFPGVL